MAVFWNVAPCSLVDIDRRVRGVLMTNAVSCSETSVSIYQITRRNIPEDSNLHTHRRENLKSYLAIFMFLTVGKTELNGIQYCNLFQGNNVCSNIDF
jgi:hypothetical protein